MFINLDYLEKNLNELVRQLKGDFLESPMVKTVLPLQRAWVQSFIGELRFPPAEWRSKKKKKLI